MIVDPAKEVDEDEFRMNVLTALKFYMKIIDI